MRSHLHTLFFISAGIAGIVLLSDAWLAQFSGKTRNYARKESVQGANLNLFSSVTERETDSYDSPIPQRQLRTSENQDSVADDQKPGTRKVELFPIFR